MLSVIFLICFWRNSLFVVRILHVKFFCLDIPLPLQVLLSASSLQGPFQILKIYTSRNSELRYFCIDSCLEFEIEEVIYFLLWETFSEMSFSNSKRDVSQSGISGSISICCPISIHELIFSIWLWMQNLNQKTKMLWKNQKDLPFGAGFVNSKISSARDFFRCEVEEGRESNSSLSLITAFELCFNLFLVFSVIFISNLIRCWLILRVAQNKVKPFLCFAKWSTSSLFLLMLKLYYMPWNTLFFL